jgi:hypothetical protein
LQQLRQGGVLKKYLKKCRRLEDFVAAEDQEILPLKVST